MANARRVIVKDEHGERLISPEVGDSFTLRVTVPYKSTDKPYRIIQKGRQLRIKLASKIATHSFRAK